MAVKKVSFSMPAGDTRSIPISIPVSTYQVGSKIFFTMKPQPLPTTVSDSTAVLEKTLTDSNIISNDGTNVNYSMTLAPGDTLNINPATYQADFEYVSSDGTIVIHYPDPDIQQLLITIGLPVTRRTS